MGMNTVWMKKIDWLSGEIIAYIEKCEKAIEAGLNEFAIVGCRTCAEQVLRTLYRLNGWKKDANYSFAVYSDNFQFKAWLDDSLTFSGIKRIREFGNSNAHCVKKNGEGTGLANEMLQYLVRFVWQSCEKMGRPEVPHPFPFWRIDYKKGVSETKVNELEKSLKQSEEDMKSLQERIKTAEIARRQAEEKQRIAEAAQKKAEAAKVKALKDLRKSEDKVASLTRQASEVKGLMKQATDQVEKAYAARDAAEKKAEEARSAAVSAIKDVRKTEKELELQKMENASVKERENLATARADKAEAEVERLITKKNRRKILF